jgi:hypothetical protein
MTKILQKLKLWWRAKVLKLANRAFYWSIVLLLKEDPERLRSFIETLNQKYVEGGKKNWEELVSLAVKPWKNFDAPIDEAFIHDIGTMEMQARATERALDELEPVRYIRPEQRYDHDRLMEYNSTREQELIREAQSKIDYRITNWPPPVVPQKPIYMPDDECVVTADDLEEEGKQLARLLMETVKAAKTPKKKKLSKKIKKKKGGKKK